MNAEFILVFIDTKNFMNKHLLDEKSLFYRRVLKMENFGQSAKEAQFKSRKICTKFFIPSFFFGLSKQVTACGNFFVLFHQSTGNVRFRLILQCMAA